MPSDWLKKASLFVMWLLTIIHQSVILKCSIFWLKNLWILRFGLDQATGLMSRVFANGPGDRGSIPGRVMPKTQKIVLDATLLNIIIMSCHQHGYHWSSLATSSYHSSLLVGLQGNIPYPHIAAVCMFELVILLLLGHMWGSTGAHHWWVCPCFSSSVLHVWFV